ncbi:MAG: two component transcriptional regulator, LuxR family [Gammaproteobacteria bacterium]|jgi:DNA-binding NarL/FixJ family response regulator|nr:two component transcriptional regulator, LuxR family [Gammaproteobacteria bacterium]
MSEKSSIRILCVDDHPLLLDGIAALIGTEPQMRLVAEASSGVEAVRQFRATLPDITLMDLQMRGMNGVDAIGAIRTEWPWAKIIVLSAFGGDAMAQRALKAGAQAYLLKGLVRGELLDTIRLVHGGAKWIQAEVASSIAAHVADTALTDREVEVLGLIAHGKSNKLIAHNLSIHEETAKTHVKHILAKLHANDRTHAVTLALRRGIIPL